MRFFVIGSCSKIEYKTFFSLFEQGTNYVKIILPHKPNEDMLLAVVNLNDGTVIFVVIQIVFGRRFLNQVKNRCIISLRSNIKIPYFLSLLFYYLNRRQFIKRRMLGCPLWNLAVILIFRILAFWGRNQKSVCNLANLKCVYKRF